MPVLILGSILTLSVPLTSLAQGGQPTQNVNVLNNPLPISGNVTVTNAPSQPVPVVG